MCILYDLGNFRLQSINCGNYAPFYFVCIPIGNFCLSLSYVFLRFHIFLLFQESHAMPLDPLFHAVQVRGSLYSLHEMPMKIL